MALIEDALEECAVLRGIEVASVKCRRPSAAMTVSGISSTKIATSPSSEVSQPNGHESSE